MSVRLAMWSGPRNISTAMMRAWENRPDTTVWDEPLYAYYLQATGLDHPMRDEVIADGLPNWSDVTARVTGPIPDNATVFYLKHMTHHLLPAVGRDWLRDLTHVFLIRDPREVLLSYSRSIETVTLESIGFPQQAAIYDGLIADGQPAPLVIDSGEFLQSPREYLERICQHIGVAFTEAMLAWPAGRRESDGAWAPHWYTNVEASTGFAPWRERSGELAPELAEIERTARPIYDQLFAHRLRLDT
ncbi:MAG: HAD family hydrolase [Opitutaceae bacterium]|nr:HAD family hydrolase [Opitutaceae bacterium]